MSDKMNYCIDCVSYFLNKEKNRYFCADKKTRIEDVPCEFFEQRCDDDIDNHWHTGTPTKEGYYLCKVFYDKNTENDMRVLEWVKELRCFCIPYSKIRAYHYYVGENNGEQVEVVYEWQKLDMRFRMETKWIEPYEEDA